MFLFYSLCNVLYHNMERRERERRRGRGEGGCVAEQIDRQPRLLACLECFGGAGADWRGLCAAPYH